MMLDFVRHAVQPFLRIGTQPACVKAAALPALFGVVPDVEKLSFTIFSVACAQEVFATLSGWQQLQQLKVVSGPFFCNGQRSDMPGWLVQARDSLSRFEGCAVFV